MTKTTNTDAQPAEGQEALTLPQVATSWAKEFAKGNAPEVERNAGYYTEGAGVEQRKALGEVIALVELRKAVEEEIRLAIGRARKSTGGGYYGDRQIASWDFIGKALGVTKQSAQSRYGK